jgi:hypothetical protein
METKGWVTTERLELAFIEDSGLWNLCRPLNFLLAHPSSVGATLGGRVCSTRRTLMILLISRRGLP